MIFRKLQGVRVPEEQQGLIRFTCLNYNRISKRTQQKIVSLCESIGGEYSSALFDVMCSKSSISRIALKHNVSESVLYSLRKQFYESW